MIFMSTGGLRNVTAAEAAMHFFRQGILGVELSSGAFSATYEADLMALPSELTLQLHNYFPPPAISFVLNLASTDLAIAEQSVQLVRTAIRLAVLLRRPVYSFHAGFRLNPRVGDLGKTLGRYDLVDREIALDQFEKRVVMLAEEARREGVTLLIENNVITMASLANYGEDPLLLTHPDEISSFMAKMPSNVGLLLDVAHLKVSARTHGFDLLQAHAKVEKWIKGYHLSDNDATSDSNEYVTSNSWFWEVLIPGLDYYSLEIYNATTASLVEQCRFLAAKLAVRSA